MKHHAFSGPEPVHRLVRGTFRVALLFVFIGAEIPGEAVPQIALWDKAEHFICFYALAVLGAATYPRRSLLIIGFWLSAFGALIEVVQAIPALHRDCDFWDWVADTVAIAAALGPVGLGRLREWIRDSP